jgi:hypothetical protein
VRHMCDLGKSEGSSVSPFLSCCSNAKVLKESQEHASCHSQLVQVFWYHTRHPVSYAPFCCWPYSGHASASAANGYRLLPALPGLHHLLRCNNMPVVLFECHRRYCPHLSDWPAAACPPFRTSSPTTSASRTSRPRWHVRGASGQPHTSRPSLSVSERVRVYGCDASDCAPVPRAVGYILAHWLDSVWQQQGRLQERASCLMNNTQSLNGVVSVKRLQGVAALSSNNNTGGVVHETTPPLLQQ